MPQAIRLITAVPDEVVARMMGRHPTECNYNRVIGERDADWSSPRKVDSV